VQSTNPPADDLNLDLKAKRAWGLRKLHAETRRDFRVCAPDRRAERLIKAGRSVGYSSLVMSTASKSQVLSMSWLSNPGKSATWVGLGHNQLKKINQNRDLAEAGPGETIAPTIEASKTPLQAEMANNKTFKWCGFFGRGDVSQPWANTGPTCVSLPPFSTGVATVGAPRGDS
jgi:hypothetical protein